MQEPSAGGTRGPSTGLVTRAVWNGVTLAEAPSTVVVEGNHYFPPDTVRWDHLMESRSRSLCPWKGIARYYTVSAGGAENPNAAWRYQRPTPLARRIKGHVAFWRGVQIEQHRSTDGGVR